MSNHKSNLISQPKSQINLDQIWNKIAILVKFETETF